MSPHPPKDAVLAVARERAAAVYCRGPLMDAVQRLCVFGDGKHFVDMPMRADPEDILRAFDQLPQMAQQDPQMLKAFVEEHFLPPGAELDPCVPEDFPGVPPFVADDAITDEALREFSVALHELWPTLCRRTASSVTKAPHRSSSLPRKHVMVLPGGRFRETYYWDCLWIVKGLLASGMVETAQGLVQNLLDDVASFGFVPNGGRLYYLNRSQPPLLHAMVAAVAGRMGAEEEARWLPQALRRLRKEYEFWMSPENHRAVQVGEYTLNRFCAAWDEPRPESYWEDVVTSGGSRDVCREIASGAETGWDFTSRWGRAAGRIDSNNFELESMEVTRILPVDLNAKMYSFERCLAGMCEAVARGKRLAGAMGISAESLRDPEAVEFAAAAARRRAAFQDLFWREDLGRWTDVWLPAASGAPAAEAFDPRDLAALNAAERRAPTVADFAAPLWAGLAEGRAHTAMAALRKSGLLCPGGVLTTRLASGEQWDAPNAWPPMQSMLVEGLRATGAPEGAELALELARLWVGSCRAAWLATGHMHEKYSAAEFGEHGGGGEYEPQVGFAWSNGVVLQFLEMYGDSLAGACS